MKNEKWREVLYLVHSSMSRHRAPFASKPGRHWQEPFDEHSALLVQSKSDPHPVLTSAGSQPVFPFPWYPAGHSHLYPGWVLIHLAPIPQWCSERDEHSSISEKNSDEYFYALMSCLILLKTFLLKLNRYPRPNFSKLFTSFQEF